MAITSSYPQFGNNWTGRDRIRWFEAYALFPRANRLPGYCVYGIYETINRAVRKTFKINLRCRKSMRTKQKSAKSIARKATFFSCLDYCGNIRFLKCFKNFNVNRAKSKDIAAGRNYAHVLFRSAGYPWYTFLSYFIFFFFLSRI